MTLYWLLGSSVQKQALRDGETNPYPACKHSPVSVESDVVNSRLMLERQYTLGGMQICFLDNTV